MVTETATELGTRQKIKIKKTRGWIKIIAMEQMKIEGSELFLNAVESNNDI